MKPPYLLADDLSGALEAGAAFHDAGWRVVLPLTADAVPADEACQLTVISSETRSLGAMEAAAVVRRVVTERRAAGSRLLFKKIDSTLRGPLGAELSALASELTPRLVVVCPANPGAGRTVLNGVLQVNGVMLRETDFRNDPAWPATTSEVWALLGEQGVKVAGHVPQAVLARGQDATRLHIAALCRGGQGTCVLVSDALVQEDIRTVVLAALDVEPDTVFVGSGAMSPVLAGLLPPPQSAAPASSRMNASMVVLCGSRHPASHRQIDRLARECGAAVLLTSPGGDLTGLVAAVVAALDTGRPVAVKCDPALCGYPPGAITEWLAEVAFALARTRPPGVFYLTGGETAFGVCRRLDGRRLEILRSLETGVVLSRLTRSNQTEIALITKPGGYGTDSAMVFHFHEIK